MGATEKDRLIERIEATQESLIRRGYKAHNQVWLHPESFTRVFPGIDVKSDPDEVTVDGMVYNISEAIPSGAVYLFRADQANTEEATVVMIPLKCA